MNEIPKSDDNPDSVRNWLPDPEQVKVIGEAVARYNEGRPAEASRMRKRLFAMIAPVVIIAAALVIIGIATGLVVVIGLGAAILIGGGALMWTIARGPAEAYQQELRSKLFPVIFSFIDGFEYKHGRPGSFLGRIVKTGLFNYNRSTHDDWFAGSHEGTQFELTETHLSKKSGKNTRTIFDGLIFHIRRDSNFRGMLMAKRKTGAVTRFFREMFGSSLTEIETGVGEIDDSHEFRTDTPGETTAALAVKTAKAIDWLQEAWPHGPVQIVFVDADCFVLLAARKDHFELPGITASDIDFDRHILPLIRDMVTLLAIAGLIRKIDDRK